MRSAIKFSMTMALIMLFVVPALAQAPVNGVYKSTDIGGAELLTGHSSESWFAGAPVSQSNAISAGSWDGGTYGVQWSISCPTVIAAPTLLLDTVDGNGNGQRTYLKIFTGGTFSLVGGPAGTPAWSGGDAAYTGSVNIYNEVQVIQFNNFVPTGSNITVNLTGEFTGHANSCYSLISNGQRVGTTDTAALPAGYPPFPAMFSCAPTVLTGSWWDRLGLTMTIKECVVATEETTWGGIKAIYTE